VPAPALLSLDVGLMDPGTLLVLPVFDREGKEVSRSIEQIKLLPRSWPELAGVEPLSSVFDGSLVLEGAQLEEGMVRPGGTLTLDLYWSSLSPTNEDYTVFVHLLNEHGDLVGQGDGPPVSGRYPTSAWSPGELILDRHVVPVSNETPSGNYTLVAGLYRGSDGTRLMIDSLGKNATDTVVLGEIHVH
jgi:hypothetical protein